MKIHITALLTLLTSLIYSQSSENEREYIEKMIVESGVHFQNAEYNKALNLSKNALAKSFKINDDYYISHSYNSIGAVYDEFSQSKRAIEFYNKALIYANRIENDSLRDWIYSNLGSVYYFNDIDVKKGIDYYKKSLHYAQKINDSSQIAYSRLNIASAYFHIEDFISGIEFVNVVQDYIERKGEDEAKMSYLSLLGIYNSNTGSIADAESYFFEAIALAKKNNFKASLANLYENVSLHYKRHNKPDDYKVYNKKYEALTRSIYSEEKIDSLDESAMEIELDEYKSQLEKIEASNDKQQKKILTSRIISLLLGIILIISLLLLYTLYRSNKARKKLNAALVKTNQELLIANKKAEDNAQVKTQFVSTVSHELRTPLYGVVGITSIILEEHKELVNSNHLNSLRFSARYLLALVNDILQINKMEENKIILKNTTFNLREEINTIKNSLYFIADNHDNTLEIEFDSDIPEYLMGDELRLSQILMNLISNALKFTQNGQVKILIDLDKKEDNKYFIKFQVKDNGVGISQENQQKIFEKFVQIERKDGDYQGTGLGLTIVKRLIELFGSKIDVESEEKIGTTFTFIIAFEASSQEKILKGDSVVSIDTPLNILVVEDNKINQMVTQKIIERKEHNCILVENGYDAIELVQKEKFDVILMDINMPMIDGYETAKSIRALGIKTPIIALTAFDKNEVTKKAMISGIDDIVIKPFNPSELFAAILNQVDINSSNS